MVTGGLESVLIGDPVDGQDDAIGSGEGVRPFGSSQKTSVIRTSDESEKPLLGHARSGQTITGVLDFVCLGNPVDGQCDAFG